MKYPENLYWQLESADLYLEAILICILKAKLCNHLCIKYRAIGDAINKARKFNKVKSLPSIVIISVTPALKTRFSKFPEFPLLEVCP
jgi:hypothetical protein